MADMKPEGWRRLLQPHDAAGKNSMSFLRRSSSWRRPGERGYYEGPMAQVNEPPRGARPQSCIEGGRMDKWLQTLERLQSRRLQKQVPEFSDWTVSMPALPNETMGSNPHCLDLNSLHRRNQTPSACSSVCESSPSSMESVHIKPVPSAEKANFCALAPVRFGWLPIQRHVILTDVPNNRQDNSRGQQKLKSPITPVLLSSPAKHNRPRPIDGEPKRAEPAGFRYWRTAEKTTPVLQQALGSVSSEGGPNRPQAWNSKNSKVDMGQSHPDNTLPKHPIQRRGSAPESFSSSISSITITSKKVTHTSSPLNSTNSLNIDRRKPLVVKVTEQQIKTTNQPAVSNQELNDHGVVLRRKATIVKMTEQREEFSRGIPKYRHSYTEGLKNSAINLPKVNPSPVNQALTVSLEPGGNQWRSTLSLHLASPNTTAKNNPRQRPLSCDASLFNNTEPTFNAVADPALNNKSSAVAHKTNIDCVSSSVGEARSRSASSGTDGRLKTEGFRESVSEVRAPLTLLKVPENSDVGADAVLALNAAAVIANIKLQVQQRRKSSLTAAEDRGNNEHRELKDEVSDNDRKKKTPPAASCVQFVPFETGNVAPEGLSLSEALAHRRPGFIRRSQARVRAVECRSEERRKAEILQDRESLLKSKDRSIMEKGPQMRSRRSYNQLPEVKKRREEEKRKKEEEKRKLVSRTNRLRAELFKKKLLEQILQRGGNH
ncbi:(E2-independent) E3 ubiquitin-conjugating enzyme FATS isoform X2 [Danio rerio]|uniref:(E2-independent) E3 ubiquitin-conjugating enzyme FATS isoform X2 n=2 Tax=Danio rerio TaxID=7955 RepID=A0AC58GZ68_DANRE|nr:centrosomal protein C10orf90 homolog isoform X2 [Danio rerio]|eukprot:XP_017214063.1 centrosomal protein C10orf90 homolog isoform X2 [Danio rerio]